jgi:Flp pilus assembly protein TadD/mono/diheme cytochrome c family protein
MRVPFLFAALATAAWPAKAEVITFYKHITPILYHSCAPCHRPGEAGPFSLLTYEDAKKHALQIVAVTRRRYMPPWLPEPGCGDFQDEQRISDAQIRTIEQWVREGARAGDPADAGPMPKFTPGWQLGAPDLVLQASRPYSLPADSTDQYWNFVLPLKLAGTRWVKAIEIRPGNARAVHHANVLIDRTRSAQTAEESPGSGFPGMDLNIEADTFDPDSHFLFWKPGGIPWEEPDGMAWKADSSTDLILNVHMQPTGKPEMVQPSVGLYFTDRPATKFPMLLQLEHDGALDIPAGSRDFLVSDDFTVPMDVDVLAVYPHAHYLGHLLEGYATLPGGSRKWLIRIPDWDVNWQAVYRYTSPVFLPKGSVVSMRFHYDNSDANPRNPNHPAKRVRGGNQATDEMSHLWLQVLPRGAEDRRMELQEAIMRHRLDKYPGDFSAHFNLGALQLARGNAAEAMALLRSAVEARPDQPVALNTLGAALLTTGNASEAVGTFERALRSNPRYTNARYNLANALAEGRQWEQAAAQFRQVLDESPDDAGARQHLGELLRLWGDDLTSAGRLEDAASRYRESLRFCDDDVIAAALHSDLGAVLAKLGKFREAIPEFEIALRLDPLLDTAKRNLQAAKAMLERTGQQGPIR